MVDPVGTTLVSGAAHGDKGTIQSFGDAGGLMVMSGRGREVDAGGAHYFCGELGGQVGSKVVADATGGSVATDNVSDEDVHEFGG